LDNDQTNGERYDREGRRITTKIGKYTKVQSKSEISRQSQKKKKIKSNNLSSDSDNDNVNNLGKKAKRHGVTFADEVSKDK